jgi:hypothetical protein
VEGVLWIEESGCVDENHLDVVCHSDAQHAGACCLRLGARDSEFFADESIEESGLSGVGKADEGDETGAGGGEDRGRRRKVRVKVK